MSIASETTRTGPYSGNGSTTTFSYTFYVADQGDLEVVLTNSSGVETIKTITTHYSVTGVGNSGGGNVVMGSAPASGETLTIRRKITKTQTTSLTNQDGYRGETHESFFDKVIQITQEINEVVSRSANIPVSTATTVSPQLPAPTANKVIGVWNSDGNAIEIGPSVTDISNASANATSAASSASTASGHKDTATTKASEASASAVAAAASAALIAQGTASTTSLAIATGSKAFTISAGLGFNVGDFVLCTSNADTTNYMHGQIASYSGTTLTVTVSNIGGSGTKSDWTIRLSSIQGSTGSTGSTGSVGPTGPVGVGLAIALS
jgi:hypothetical protein